MELVHNPLDTNPAEKKPDEKSAEYDFKTLNQNLSNQTTLS